MSRCGAPCPWYRQRGRMLPTDCLDLRATRWDVKCNRILESFPWDLHWKQKLGLTWSGLQTSSRVWKQEWKHRHGYWIFRQGARYRKQCVQSEGTGGSDSKARTTFQLGRAWTQYQTFSGLSTKPLWSLKAGRAQEHVTDRCSTSQYRNRLGKPKNWSIQVYGPKQPAGLGWLESSQRP